MTRRIPRTFHVYKDDAGWIVKRLGRPGTVYSNKKDAVDAAMRQMKRLAYGQMVVHAKDGTATRSVRHNLPRIMSHPLVDPERSRLIARAVGKLVMEKLKSDPIPLRV